MKQGFMVILTGLLLVLAGCSSITPPARIGNLCHLFQEKSSWYRAAKRANEKWGTPIQVMMAIMHQESRFRHDAQPPRPWFLFIPLPRRSSAYGYAQAQDGTWEMYLNDVSGWFQSRENFNDSIDFIGWYTNMSRKNNGVSLWHADEQYLNYHEGWGGYRRGTYHKKPWLIKVARKVKWRAGEYGEQLKLCNL